MNKSRSEIFCFMTRPKTSVQVFVEEQLNDPEVAESFYQGLDELRLAVKIAQLRKHRGLTQAQLAARLDTSTPVISRLENQGNCSIKTLKKVAEALDAVVQIDIVAKKVEDSQKMQPSSLG